MLTSWQRWMVMGMSKPVFDIVGVKTDENGNYIALIDRYDNEISFKTKDGEKIPFNKEAVDAFLRKQEEARQ
jgi:hypothetical protein